MAIAKITLIGFNNFMASNNDDLFKYLNVPADIDKQTLINNILLRGGEFESLYCNPYFLQNMIGVWSNKWQRTFEKWVEALNIDYEPLYNFDRHEVYKDIRSENESGSRTEKATANDTSISSGSGTTTNTVSAYDASTYQPHDQSTSSSTGNNTSNATTNATGSDSRKRDETLDHDAHLFGNIGVTTSQQMLQDQLDIVQWNIYEHITDLFLEEFAVYVYE